ncbi:GYF domain-containing protein mpd2 [Leucoagaricus sp. SymC.cos]|nr:GYF domain-containing protein mpd2 [Leucoagaricus sp. SymC.cos]
MTTTTMHFGPEWMRPKHQSISRPQQPPSPPLANPPSASTYSALVSPAPPNQAERNDEVHPFRYSKDELFKIYKDGGGNGGLGLEVERWEGVVREYGSDPVGLREMGEAEKKLFAGPLNSDVRRRQATDYLSPLSTTNLGSGSSRLNHNSSAAGSPMRERFGNIKRRDSNADSPNPALPRKQSLSSLQAPVMSPREIGLPSPRTRVGYTPSFDGVLNGGDSWVARRRTSETSQKPGGSATGLHGESDFSEKAEGIKEEKEEVDGSGPVLDSLDGAQDSSPSTSTGISGSQNAKDVDNLAGGVGQLSLNTNISNPVDNVQNHSGIGTPPGLVDPPSIEWSYKDPTGTVQGPFSAELMQKWYDDGYFTPDLPMKRTHLDTTWTTLEQLRRRSVSERVFLTPLQTVPPGLSMRTDSPLQYNAPDQTMIGPYQPAPIRSLRTPALESYISTGSNHSESPSSSFGGGRFGDSSPEPNAFGGRAIGGQYFNGDHSGSARSSGFQTTPEIPSAFSGRRVPHADSPIDGSMGMRPSSFGTYGFSNPFGSTQSPWGAPANNFSSGYEAIDLGRDSHEHLGLQNYANQGLGINYGGLRSTQDPIVDPSQSTAINYAVGPDTTEANLQRNSPFDSNQSTATDVVPQSSVAPTSPWNQPVQNPTISVPKDASSWVIASHGVVDSAWGQSGETAPAPDETRAEVESHQSPVDQASVSITSESLEELKSEPETVELSPPASGAKAQPTSGKSRKHREPKVSAAVAPQAPTQPEVPSPQVAAPKLAWQKEDEVKKTISLREIQEAEAKKAEAKKAAERERERTARIAATSSLEKEDLQSFTASWGLPTSQAGSRGSGALPVKEPVTSPTTAPTAAPVWTNAPKITPAKKTMKEILEEEEKRKKVAPQVTAAAAVAASSSGRLYAQSSTKPPPAAAATSGGAWTTVGPNGKSNPVVAAAARPSTTTAPAASRSSGPTSTRPTQPSAAKAAPAPTPRAEDVTPSHEFLNWLNGSLKGLNKSVSVEEIMHMLLSFPIEVDASIREIISETIYTNSTTMDGRRFAEEFVSRRKADAISHAKNGGPSKGTAKPVSIADVVKATPKTTQPEWGFKVVNKKKKGGRS